MFYQFVYFEDNVKWEVIGKNIRLELHVNFFGSYAFHGYRPISQRQIFTVSQSVSQSVSQLL